MTGNEPFPVPSERPVLPLVRVEQLLDARAAATPDRAGLIHDASWCRGGVSFPRAQRSIGEDESR
jgi:hypothetical protein